MVKVYGKLENDNGVVGIAYARFLSCNTIRHCGQPIGKDGMQK